jgi:hypothetical protein
MVALFSKNQVSAKKNSDSSILRNFLSGALNPIAPDPTILTLIALS